MKPNVQSGVGGEGPVAESRSDAAGSKQEPLSTDPRTSGEPAGSVSLPPAVLVIDDEAPVRQIAVRILQRAGYVVKEAAGGVEALEMVLRAERRFDAVLLDLTMPQMDGAQTLHALLENDPAARVLLMSGYGEQDTLSRVADDAVAGFVPKPFSAEILLRKVREILPL